MLAPRPMLASNRETSSKLARAWLSNRFAAVLPREADREAGSGTGVDGWVGEGVVESRLMLSGGADKREDRMRADLLGALYDACRRGVIRDDELGRW